MGTILALHIVCGGLGMLSGVTALLSPKGARLHVRCGIAFWYLMSAMALSGILLAILHPRPVFILIAVLSIYLVNTGRNALTRSGGKVDRSTRIWFGVALACCVSGLGFGSWSIASGAERFGDPPVLFFGVAFDALIFSVLDWRLIRSGRATGKSRVIDHLWRMVAALLFASFALFVANPRIFPSWFTETGLNFLPSLTLLVLLAYWIVSVRSRKPIGGGI